MATDNDEKIDKKRMKPEAVEPEVKAAPKRMGGDLLSTPETPAPVTNYADLQARYAESGGTPLYAENNFTPKGLTRDEQILAAQIKSQRIANGLPTFTPAEAPTVNVPFTGATPTAVPASVAAPAAAAPAAAAAVEPELSMAGKLGRAYGKATTGTAGKVASGAGRFLKGGALVAADVANEFIPRASNDTWYGKLSNVARDVGSDTMGMIGQAQIPALIAGATGVGAAAIPAIEAAGLYGGLAKGTYNAYKKWKAGGYDAAPAAAAQPSSEDVAKDQLKPSVPWRSGAVGGGQSVGVLRNPDQEVAGDYSRNPDTGKITETVRDDAGYNTGTITEGKNANGTAVRTLYSPDGKFLGYSYGAPPMQKEFDAAKQQQIVRDSAERLGFEALDRRKAEDAAQRERANNFFATSASNSSLDRAVGAGTAISQDPVRNANRVRNIVDAVRATAVATGADPMEILRSRTQGIVDNPNYNSAMEELRSGGRDMSNADRTAMVMSNTPHQYTSHTLQHPQDRQAEAQEAARHNSSLAMSADARDRNAAMMEERLRNYREATEMRGQQMELSRENLAQREANNKMANFIKLNGDLHKLEASRAKTFGADNKAKLEADIEQARKNLGVITSQLGELGIPLETEAPATAPGAAPAGQPKKVDANAPVAVTSKEQYDKLPSGTRYVDAKGVVGTKK